MIYTISNIKEDIKTLSAKQFYIKYLLRSDNWYFENILDYHNNDLIHTIDDFKCIISDNLKINLNCISMVGSGKIGYSLAPIEEKLYRQFNNDEQQGKLSDLDIAIVSSELFNKYWYLLRHSFSPVYSAYYKYIPTEIYRGYINEKYLSNIPNCRKEWIAQSSASKKALTANLFIKHQITYRLYRNWEDVEHYHIQSIVQIQNNKLKTYINPQNHGGCANGINV